MVAALICGGVVLESWSHPRRVAAVPRDSPQDLAREWHGAFPSSVPGRSWAQERLSLSRRQSAVVVGQPTAPARVCLVVPLPT